MKFKRTRIPDVVLIEPIIYNDDRGYFYESFRQDLFEQNIGKIDFVQDNESKSSYGVLRGLHYQLPPFEQGKLVSVTKGAIMDVAVDLREGSLYFGNYVSVILNSKEKNQLYIPRGFAHGFLVLSDEAIVRYKVDNYYAKNCERGIIYNDPNIDINWGMDNSLISISQGDSKLPRFVTADLFACSM
jgi:dTDP-4-dehydrorhamnose 3,5-epimerase